MKCQSQNSLHLINNDIYKKLDSNDCIYFSVFLILYFIFYLMSQSRSNESQDRNEWQRDQNGENNSRFPGSWRSFDQFHIPNGFLPPFQHFHPPPPFVQPLCECNENFRSDFYCMRPPFCPFNCGNQSEAVRPFCPHQFVNSGVPSNEFRGPFRIQNFYNPFCPFEFNTPTSENPNYHHENGSNENH